MEANKIDLKNIYRIRVCSTTNYQVAEWHGILTLSTQDDGEIYIDLTFDEQPIVHTPQR